MMGPDRGAEESGDRVRGLGRLLDLPRRLYVLLAASEFVLLACSMYAAAGLRYLGNPTSAEAYVGPLLPRALVFAAMLALALGAVGLYQAHSRETLQGQFIRAALAFVLGGVGLIVLYYIWPSQYVGRGILILALVVGVGLIGLSRVVFARMVSQEVLKRRVLVLGAGRKAALLTERLRRRSDRRGFQLIGFVPMRGEAVAVPADLVIPLGERLAETVRRLAIDELVIGPEDRRDVLPMEDLVECRLAGTRVIDLIGFIEREIGSIKFSLMSPAWVLSASGFDGGGVERPLKRGFDLLVSALALLPALPLMLLTALAIMLESGPRQPVLYMQERVGLGGRVFRVIKFRSMRPDAEKDGVARWATKSDDRVTRVGRVIRKLRLDELPQILNVLRGEMSWVGPRPERPQFVAELARQIPYYELRHCVKPGITGWAQLRYPYGSSVQDAEEKLKFDLYYVKHHGLLFDFSILLQTVEVVLFGKGAR